MTTYEQFSCCSQYVDSGLTVKNIFLGFYNAPDTTAATLNLCVKDVFLHLSIPMARIQG